MTAASVRSPRSRRSRAVRIVAMIVIVLAAIPVGMFLIVAGIAGERR